MRKKGGENNDYIVTIDLGREACSLRFLVSFGHTRETGL